MTITDRPTNSARVLGGAIALPERPCQHGPSRSVSPWTGETGTVGTVTVVGAGKMGLPLAAQFASHGWNVVAFDIDPGVVAEINEGRSHFEGEPDLAERVADAYASDRLRGTTDGPASVAGSDVVVLIVPVMLDANHQPDYRHMDAAVDSIGAWAAHWNHRHLRDDVTCWRYPQAVRPASRGGHRTLVRVGSSRRVLAGTAVQRRGLPQSRDLPQARRRRGAAID